MAMEKLILYSLCLITSIGKSETQTTANSLQPVSSISVQDTVTDVSSTSVLSSVPSSISTSSEPISSSSMSTSQSVVGAISTSTSVRDLGSLSTTTDFSSSTSVSQSAHPVTQNTLDMNSTALENESTTTLNPGTFNTDFSFNKWSNTFPGITSYTGSTGVTNPPVEHTTTSQNNSSDVENASLVASISSVVNDTVHKRTSSIEHELINTTQTSVSGFAATEIMSTTESLTSSLDSLHSSITQISDKSFSSTSLPEELISPQFETSSTSGFVSSSRLDFPSISASSASSASTSILNVSKSETVLLSIPTDYFTESVYSLANISSTQLSGIVSSPSIEVTIGKSSDSTLLFQSQTRTAPDRSLHLSPTQTSSVRNTASASESIYSSETEIPSSPTVVSLLSTSDISSISSAVISASDTVQSLPVNKTSISDSTTWTISTPSISVPVPEASNSTISSYSVTSNIISRGGTQSASISPTALSEVTMPTSSQMTTATQRPTTKSSTPNILTTSRNATEPPVELERRIYRLMFTFEGHCERISENEILQIEFLKALMEVTKSTTKLISYNLEAERILCEPLRIYLRADTRGLNISHLSAPLKNKIALSEFVVPIIQNTHVTNFTATKLEIVEILSSDSDGLEVAKSGLEVVDIVIIGIASFLFAVLVLMMVIVICRECYVRKRTTTFHLRDVPHVNLKLSEFTLTRIPRPQMFYRENSRRKHGPVPVSKIRKPQTNGHSDTKDKVKVNQDQIRVRMSKHDDGLVVGVTCSAPPSPTNNSSSCSSTPKNGDSCKMSLLKGSNTEVSDGVTNPSYSTDEELNGNTKIVIQEDENEQLL